MTNYIAAVEIKSPYKRSPMEWYQAVSPYVCVCQRGSHWTIYVNSQIFDFMESEEKFQIWLLKPGEKNRAFYMKN
jgi:hypothetical protein